MSEHLFESNICSFLVEVTNLPKIERKKFLKIFKKVLDKRAQLCYNGSETLNKAEQMFGRLENKRTNVRAARTSEELGKKCEIRGAQKEQMFDWRLGSRTYEQVCICSCVQQNKCLDKKV